MNEEVKRQIFSSFETESIILPIENLVYHLYRYNYYKKKKKDNEAKKELTIIKYYIKNNNQPVSGEMLCSKNQ